MENNEKQTLIAVLTEVLGDDFDVEKIKTLETKINAHVGTTTVPKPVFNETNSKLKEIKEKLKQRADDLKDANVWKKQIEDLTADFTKQLKEKDDALNDYRLTQYLKEQKAKNPKAVKALLDLGKITFEGDDIKGLDEQLELMRSGNDSFLFDKPADTAPKGTGGFPANPPQQTAEAPKTATNKII